MEYDKGVKGTEKQNLKKLSGSHEALIKAGYDEIVKGTEKQNLKKLSGSHEALIKAG